ncbi:helix-turn-helix transcriptional regulator [Lipingzhangella sp. LS1_29]|uniref:Helix-turn-helix transcriptional regulator n=1 Tax=Lipingzhangella rawalii TaxID=2055835 RepID=A0ABU2H8S4_9ACTN|nr:helix-turn-helix transcriptional regulator [Lipingzhangella rawalii]MDS1271707.1 helix-turn-helix transcriptional regulator [Lipingzhangella rawalii]
MPVGKPKRVTLRARWLGQRLRELRDASGQTIEEVAEYLQRSMGTVSRFESGIYPIRRTEVTALLDLYAVNDARTRANLLKIANDVWQTGWWDGYTGEVEDWFIDFVWLEEQATAHLLFDTTVLPGLLQTEQYARAVMLADDPASTREQLDRAVELRLARQQLLEREEPPQVYCVLDEAVLRRRVGGRRTMTAQLRHLRQAMDWPTVSLRVLPFSAGEHASPMGAFQLYRMEDPYPEVAYVETPKGAMYIESPDTGAILERYDRLWEASLSEHASAEAISALIEEQS